METVTENEVINVTPVVDVEPTETQAEDIKIHENHCKDCSAVIAVTGKRGRPASRCDSCKVALAEKAKENRVTRCVGTTGVLTDGRGCGHQLKKHVGRGRPSHRCDSCKQKISDFRSNKVQSKNFAQLEDALSVNV